MIYVEGYATRGAMTTMGDRLREARKAARFATAADAARALGVTPSSYRAHENGQNEFGPEEASHYGRKFNVAPGFLLTGGAGGDPPTMSTINGAQGIPKGTIPEIDVTGGLGGGGFTVEAVTANGKLSFHAEVVRDHWRIPDWLFAKWNVKAAFVAAFPVQGDSMAPTLTDGDVVFFDTRHRVPSPPGLYAVVDEFGGVIVKRLEVVSRPGDDVVMIAVMSDNPRHTTRTLSLDELHIIGRYLGRFTL